MSTLGKAQTGKTSSTPKICRINADDNLPVVYKNMGNNHACPVIWADTVTMSGTEVTLADSATIHGMDLAAYANVTVTPLADPGAVRYWVEKDTGNNTIKIKSSGAITNVDFDIKYILAASNPASRYIEDIFCRGNTGASQALP